MPAEPLTPEDEALLRGQVDGLRQYPTHVLWANDCARIFATLDAERARLRSATRRYEDAEHNMLLLNDDLIAERARHAALVEALDNLARHHELERVAGNTHIHPDKCEFVMQADRALRAALDTTKEADHG